VDLVDKWTDAWQGPEGLRTQLASPKAHSDGIMPAIVPGVRGDYSYLQVVSPFGTSYPLLAKGRSSQCAAFQAYQSLQRVHAATLTPSGIAIQAQTAYNHSKAVLRDVRCTDLTKADEILRALTSETALSTLPLNLECGGFTWSVMQCPAAHAGPKDDIVDTTGGALHSYLCVGGRDTEGRLLCDAYTTHIQQGYTSNTRGCRNMAELRSSAFVDNDEGQTYDSLSQTVLLDPCSALIPANGPVDSLWERGRSVEQKQSRYQLGGRFLTLAYQDRFPASLDFGFTVLDGNGGDRFRNALTVRLGFKESFTGSVTCAAFLRVSTATQNTPVVPTSVDQVLNQRGAVQYDCVGHLCGQLAGRRLPGEEVDDIRPAGEEVDDISGMVQVNIVLTGLNSAAPYDIYCVPVSTSGVAGTLAQVIELATPEGLNKQTACCKRVSVKMGEPEYRLGQGRAAAVALAFDGSIYSTDTALSITLALVWAGNVSDGPSAATLSSLFFVPNTVDVTRAQLLALTDSTIHLPIQADGLQLGNYSVAAVLSSTSQTELQSWEAVISPSFISIVASDAPLPAPALSTAIFDNSGLFVRVREQPHCALLLHKRAMLCELVFFLLVFISVFLFVTSTATAVAVVIDSHLCTLVPLVAHCSAIVFHYFVPPPLPPCLPASLDRSH
jgi:hypothetical protein